ncbi:MAG: efflux RND transporter periplasmic adaptor subunit [Candidatus Thiodiazotropha sp. (ex Semelilucina semeliformis)]|nr:efflux RND transporter periplasmic adaptor subunit [Candidatus Thiodiazotropha sp. (ex Semelilucina semeliformis)]
MKSSILSVLILFWLSPLAASAADNLITAKPAMQREVQSGFTRARTRLVLSAEAAGRVSLVNADVGDVTGEDEAFACLDQTFIDLELQANRAEQDALVVDRTYFRKEVARIRQLLKKNSSSESQLDTAQRNLDKTQIQIQSLQIAANTLKERKSRHCIQAPAGWQVIRRHVEPGQWVNTGEPVVEVGDYRSLLVPFALSMAEYQALHHAEDELKVRLPEQQLDVSARLLRISPAFDGTSRKIQVELEIAQGIESPRGGLRVELGLDIPLRTGAVLIPEKALDQRYEQYWLKRPDGEAVRVVYLGRTNGPEGDWVSVVSPAVKPGDQFILNNE